MKAKRTVVHTFISRETKIKGELAFNGNIRLDNELEGNIVSNSGLLIIGDQALIKGDIQAEAVVIMGTVDGSIEAFDCVEVAASGKITGNIFAPNVNFEPGSVFVGRCTIGAKPKGQIEPPLETETAPAVSEPLGNELAGEPGRDDVVAETEPDNAETTDSRKPLWNETT